MKLESITPSTQFSSCSELNDIFRAAGYRRYDRTITELYGYTERSVVKTEYESRAWKQTRGEVPYHLLTPRYWKVQEQVRIMIEECFDRFCILELDEEPFGVALKVGVRSNPLTEIALYEEIIQLINPITLDFPEVDTLDYNPQTQKYESRLETPIRLRGLRFISPDESLEAFTDEPWYENGDGTHWQNGYEMLNEVVYYDIFEKYIPKAFYDLRYIYEEASEEVKEILFNGQNIEWEI